METIRQIVCVGSDRKLSLDLPETLEPGLIEVVLVLQPLPLDQSQPSENEQLAQGFGTLPRRIDPLEFQKQLRDEWNR